MVDVALYDMDKTITRAPTLLPWLMFWAAREAPWRLLLLPAVAFAGLGQVIGLSDRVQLKQFAQRLLMGRRCARHAVGRRAAEFAARVVAHGLMPGAIAQLAADRAAGRHLVLATASYDFYVVPIATALGIDTVIATRSTWNGDDLLPRVAGANCYGNAKAARFAEWAAQHPYGQLRFYSDHVSDAPLFERADVPVAVTPSRALRRLAVARRWAIVDWRDAPHAT